jgi:hemerythrin-like metal-binding protein
MNETLASYRIKRTKANEITDRQHVQIKRMYQDLRTSIVQGAGLERILKCSRDLIITTLLHFESEERAMGDTPSRSMEAHRLLHEEMIASLEDISEDLEQRRINGAMELLKFFEKRLSHHLDVEDGALERELAN